MVEFAVIWASAAAYVQRPPGREARDRLSGAGALRVNDPAAPIVFPLGYQGGEIERHVELLRGAPQLDRAEPPAIPDPQLAAAGQPEEHLHIAGSPTVFAKFSSRANQAVDTAL
ncbi:hypothetical protein A3747_13070 [Sulfitobacter sp. HI0076]|nr:hypothetical protein A3722_17980 [Sulfitobacter sp. HI0027]KZX98177.1 hypothetical protein A3720_16520 [Sulfitobacter sp. HI0021]KZZ03110.1 hypothetical protein A3747_13070 [Sulfitobacter sp. HI0076]